MPGDVLIIVGVLPFLWIAWLGIRHTRQATTLEVPVEALYTELEPAAAPSTRSRYASDSKPDALDDGSGGGPAGRGPDPRTRRP